MTRVVAHMVTRNEAGRWLELTVPRLVDQFGEVTVYDDQSTDGTADIAREAGATVTVRPDDVPAFAAHEGAFRQAAWEWTIRTLGLYNQTEPGVPGSWIISIDADEALPFGARADIEQLVSSPTVGWWSLPIREVFAVDTTGAPRERIDGEWGRIRGSRLCRAYSGLQFKDRPLASGSIPDPQELRGWDGQQAGRPVIWHLGYLQETDRVAKHARYSGTRGHGTSHVRSIVTVPTLRPLPVEDPDRPFWTAVQRRLQ